jgi:precorrin-2 dehydrogenase/sirohydrochlorin ferrochelatase
MPKYYPVNLVLENKTCVVVGAGKVAERKVKRLLECGAHVTVISPEITPGLKALAEKGKIVYNNNKVTLKDLHHAYLVISATADRKLNSTVASFCRSRGILINVVDFPKECNFILPSIVRRGDLTITISTDGISPALARKIRQDMELRFGAEYAALLRIMKQIRPVALKKIKKINARKAFFQKVLQPGIINLLKEKKYLQAKEKIKTFFKEAAL